MSENPEFLLLLFSSPSAHKDLAPTETEGSTGSSDLTLETLSSFLVVGLDLPLSSLAISGGGVQEGWQTLLSAPQ